MEHEFTFTDDFLEFAVKCSSQYDNTTRNMAREILELRKHVGELKAQMASARREAQEEIRDTVRGAQDEATWQRIQGNEYGIF